MSVALAERRRRPLITYSRKKSCPPLPANNRPSVNNVDSTTRKPPPTTLDPNLRRPLLSLDGACFLRQTSTRSDLTAPESSDDGSLTFVSPSTATDSEQTSVESIRDLTPTPSLQSLFPSDGLISYQPSPVSPADGNHNCLYDPIRESQDSSFAHSDTSCHAYKPLFTMRKSLKLSEPQLPRKPRLRTQATITTTTLASIAQGADSFTASELVVLPKPRLRLRTSAASRQSTHGGMLDVIEGPLPDVEFVRAVAADKTFRPLASIKDIDPVTEVDETNYIALDVSPKPTEIDGPNKVANDIPVELTQVNEPNEVSLDAPADSTRKVSFTDQLVYAQLSSICAPKYPESLIESSEISELEDYQMDLLRSDALEPADDVETDIEPHSFHPINASERGLPPSISRQCSHRFLVVPPQIEAEDHIMDGSPEVPDIPLMPSRTAASVRRTSTVVHGYDGRYFELARHGLQPPSIISSAPRRTPSLLDDE